MMNHKVYKVRRYILSHPNEWLSMGDIAHDTNLTSRQVVSVSKMMPYCGIEYDRDTKYNESYILFRADKAQARAAMRDLTMEYYCIPPETFDILYNTLSSVGWLSVTDISNDTEINRLDVSRVLSVMDGVVSCENGGVVLYRRLS